MVVHFHEGPFTLGAVIQPLALTYQTLCGYLPLGGCSCGTHVAPLHTFEAKVWGES